ncbi:MAG TPA: amino acid ABC transporter permease [Candidatus Agrococcus pullicola]|uniref:Amino acid ABC transporter permease n=1 Tax=Candidatus Agrococcus pullicola TaxID=2838429 RepID=A0A9D2C8S0_9MICO|nr:amino acid ABC transporter permease [Candidatus Agrococcus pullicola]
MGVITDNLDIWIPAFMGTIRIFFFGLIIALILGFIVGAMRVSPVPIARAVGAAYVNFVRNTPLTLMFFIFVFAVPPVFGYRNLEVLGILAIGLYTATYVAETVRSGINTVPVGQAEAARAVGMSFGQVMTHIVLPQAGRSVIPPMMSVIIAFLKNTTVAAGFSILNLGMMRSYMSERGENMMVVLLWTAAIFVALVFILSAVQNLLEKKLKVAR